MNDPAMTGNRLGAWASFPGKQAAGTAPVHQRGRAHEGHYRRPAERPFLAEERADTTILIGGLTRKHETLLGAVFRRHGYNVVSLPDPTKRAFRVGKEYSSNGLCNPVYYTSGALILFLKDLEAGGKTREEIENDYVYLTLSDCGPCRLGMYESEYRQALRNAGFDGFRVITTQLNRASKAGGGRPGLEFSMDQWFGLINALIVGDILYQTAYRIRPYEARRGDTDWVLAGCVKEIATYLEHRSYFELRDRLPSLLAAAVSQWPRLRKVMDAVGRFRHHYYEREYLSLLRACGDRMKGIPVDQTRARPVVKIVGEFYSHLSETDANYKMFEFLEEEGAEVFPGSVGGTLQYWFFKSRRDHLQRRGLNPPFPNARWYQFRKRWANGRAYYLKPLILLAVDRLSRRQYSRLSQALGGLAHPPTPQEQLAALTRFYYRPLTRGGEGNQEVAEGIYCTLHREAHMVLSLKPFGCMPSTQSDGVMSTISTHLDEMLFASIETTGDGDINVYSRVQMVLADAQRKASRELGDALASTGRSLGEVRDFLASEPGLCRSGFRFPRSGRFVSTAANYVLQVGRIMDRKGKERG